MKQNADSDNKTKWLNKTLDILEMFMDSRNPNELSLSELTQMSGLKKTTVNRILTGLVKRGYLSQIEKKGKYSIGGTLINLSMMIKYKIKIRDIAMPFLVKLSEIAGELVTLVNWDGKKPYVVEEIQPKIPLRVVISDPSASSPMYCTANGKIFLAAMSEKELEEYLNKTQLHAYTTNTITDADLLKSHLMKVSKELVAYDDEEYYYGIRSIAVPIRNAEGRVVSAVDLMGPAIRLTRAKLAEITPEIKNCSMEISQALGYRRKTDDSSSEKTKIA